MSVRSSKKTQKGSAGKSKVASGKMKPQAGSKKKTADFIDDDEGVEIDANRDYDKIKFGKLPTMNLSDMLDDEIVPQSQPAKKSTKSTTHDDDYTNLGLSADQYDRAGDKTTLDVKDDILSMLKGLNDKKTTKEAQPIAQSFRKQEELVRYSDQKSEGAKESEYYVPSADNGSLSELFSNSKSSQVSLSSLMQTLESHSQQKSPKFNSTMLDDSSFDDINRVTKSIDVGSIVKDIHKAKKDDATKALHYASDLQKDRIERAVAHEQATDLVSRWENVIDQMSETPQLVFPLPNPNARTRTNTHSLQTEFFSVNEFEKGLGDIIKSYGLSERDIQQREQTLLQESKLTEEDIRAKQDKVQQMKSLMFHQEQKNKRIANIKSKSYRKLKRREDKKNKLSIEELEAIDPELAEREMLKQEIARARERASLSHKTTSKWAKKQLRLKGVSETTKDALKEQMRLSQQLKKKMSKATLDEGEEGEDESDDDDDDDDGSRITEKYEELRAEYGLKSNKVTGFGDEDAINNFDIGQGTESSEGVANSLRNKKSDEKGIFSLPFMQRAKQAQLEANKKMLEEMEQDMARLDDSDDEQSNVTKKVVPETNSKFVGRVQFGPNSQAVNTIASKSTPMQPSIVKTGEKSLIITEATNTKQTTKHSNFSGGIFDVTAVEINDDDVEQNTDSLQAAKKRMKSALELANNAGVTRADASLHSVVFIDNSPAEKQLQSMLRELPSVQQAGIPTAAQVDEPKLKASTVDADVESSSEEEEEENPWTRSENSSAKKDVARRATAADSKSSKGGKFKYSNENAGSEASRAANASSISDTLGIDGISDATSVVLDASKPVLAAGMLSNLVSVEDENFDGEDAGFDVNITSQHKQAQLVNLAFDSSAYDEFVEDKKKDMEKFFPEEDPLATGVPGWGSWGGAAVKKSKGVKAKEKSKMESYQQALAQKRNAIVNARSDKQLTSVIINHDSGKTKYAVPNVYGVTAEKYKRFLRIPLGRDWNSQDSYRELIAPKVVVKQGAEIKPIEWTKQMESNLQKEKRARGDNDPLLKTLAKDLKKQKTAHPEFKVPTGPKKPKQP